ncbi:hypothetical protein ARAM_001536 [Aspergillus rambellii]|uniref:Uncharacterized protein n=1 Tax=Aspergillus rambellii TaxID=308745 RepID=A0A0F8U297_9EURO|nr:hypothetical protein ARAM_001536 [Aspergillus rambellii]
MRLIRSLTTTFFLTLTSTVLADIEFTVPNSTTTLKGGDVVTAMWKDSGKAPRISELVQYDLFLCAGGDDPAIYEDVALLMQDVALARGNSVSFAIDPKFSGNDTNAYFLKMVASGPDAFVVNFSERFTLTDMTGSFPPRLQATKSDFSTDTEDILQKRRVVVDPFTVPYSLQTGPTRYAPMAKRPGTAIATTSPVPQYPASPYNIATHYLEPATVLTTLTATDTRTLIDMENTAAPAPNPHDHDHLMKR